MSHTISTSTSAALANKQDQVNRRHAGLHRPDGEIVYVSEDRNESDEDRIARSVARQLEKFQHLE